MFGIENYSSLLLKKSIFLLILLLLKRVGIILQYNYDLKQQYATLSFCILIYTTIRQFEVGLGDNSITIIIAI